MEWSSSQQNLLNNRSSQDSAVGSGRNSYPFQDSQSSGLSQIATQDVFSQGICTPRNQIEASKPSSMYEKWKNRQAMMKRDGCIPPQGVGVGQSGIIPGSLTKAPFPNFGRWDSKSSINSVCSGAGISVNRGKPDPDERKMMEQMILMIRDCNNDVKSTLMALMEHLDKMRDLSDDQLSKSLSSFLEKLWEHEEAVKKLIEEHNACKPDLNELEINIAKKDVQISSLEKQLSESKKDWGKKHTEDIKLEVHSLQSAFLQKQEKLETLIKEGREQSELIDDSFKNISDHQEKNETWFKSLKTGIKDSEKRIVTELSKLLQKMELKTASRQKEVSMEMKAMIVKDLQMNSASNCAQSQDLDDWATSLENTFKNGLSNMLHSLEQLIERRLMISEEQNSAVRKAQTRSIGTFTDSDTQLDQLRLSKLTEYTRFDNRQLCRSTSNNSYKCCPSNESYTSNQPKKWDQGQEVHYKSQMHQGISNLDSRNVGYSFNNRSMCSSVEQILMDKESEIHRGDSDFQHRPYGASTSMNAVPANGNNLQAPLQYRMKPFVSPFKKTIYSFSSKKGPSPCAVVEPRRQDSKHQMTSELENITYAKTISQDMTKTGSKRKRKSVYTRKKNSNNKKKCSIEGLSPPKESFLRPQIIKSTRTTTPQSKQIRATLQQITNTCTIGKPEKTNITLRSQALTNGRKSMQSAIFDPYNFDEPDPQTISSKGRMTGSNQDEFARPQTRSYWGSVTDEKKNIFVIPKKLGLNKCESEQSSPSVSVESMRIERKVRTPFRGFRSIVRPPGSSAYQVPFMSRFSSKNTDIPKTLLEV